MGMFSNNQVRQFYVVNGGDVATIQDGVVTPLQSADIADIANASPLLIKNAKGEYETVPVDEAYDATTITAPRIKVLESLTTFCNDAVVPGEKYRIKLVIDQAFCDSPESVYVKAASVKATSSDTQETLAAKLAEALNKSISKRDVAYGMFDIFGGTLEEASETGIAISVNEEAMTANVQAGIISMKPILYHVECGKIVVDGSEETWGETRYGEFDTNIPNGVKVAEMEYFYHGERGDVYRNMGYPNIVATKLKTDTTANYDFVEYSTSYIDMNEDYNSSRPYSNRTITIAVKRS